MFPPCNDLLDFKWSFSLCKKWFPKEQWYRALFLQWPETAHSIWMEYISTDSVLFLTNLCYLGAIIMQWLCFLCNDKYPVDLRCQSLLIVLLYWLLMVKMYCMLGSYHHSLCVGVVSRSIQIWQIPDLCNWTCLLVICVTIDDLTVFLTILSVKQPDLDYMALQKKWSDWFIIESRLFGREAVWF